ncbi:MAG: chromosomal replication initiator protein DnaA [Burkholderiaceae bacterium]|nr:chromosomal replication initiator protein DnaA [Burkholderiaceae bacterium]
MESLWQDCLLHFERELPSQQFQTWFKPLELLRIDQNGNSSRVILSAPTRFKQNWAKNQFSAALNAWWTKTLGMPVDLEIEIGNSLINTTGDLSSQKDRPANDAAIDMDSALASRTAPLTATHAEPSISVDTALQQQSRLNGDWTFETFVPGKANQLARAAALQVADNPGRGYNPLFLYGGVGLGKSHLIHAVGNSLLAKNKQARVRYIHAEAYVSDVVKAYQRKSFDEFKRYYHSLDLLLIDDIQFFAGKQRTQEEFFYAFEALIAAQKQIIITSDTYPTELGEINPRLLTRFSSGLTVAIEPPELEMRVAILMKKADLEEFNLQEEEAFFIAKQLRSNVRELEGALKKVIAYCGFHQKTASMEVVKEALKDILSLQKTLISVENIQKSVADFYNIKVADMYSKRRPANIAMPRQVAMYLAKELTQKSFPEIGDLFGGRDHTTVLHAVKKISESRLRNAELNHQLHILEQQLKG